MADTFPGQHEDEAIDFVFRQHPIVMRRSFIYSFLVFSGGLALFLIWPAQQWTWSAAMAGAVIGLIIFGYRFISWYFSIYIITDERFIQIRQKGFFDKRVQDLSHNRIQSVNYEIKGLQPTLFKFGTITVQTFVGDLVLRYIHRPEEVQQHLNKIIRNIEPVDPRDVNGGENERATETTEGKA